MVGLQHQFAIWRVPPAEGQREVLLV